MKQRISNNTNKFSHKKLSLNLQLIDSIEDDNLKAVQSLLGKGANPNYNDKNLKNSLHHACGVQPLVNREVIKALIQHKVNINHVDNKGKSCMFYLDLAQEKIKEVIELLLKNGLNPNHQDQDKQPFIFYVCDAMRKHRDDKINYNRFLNLYKLLLMFGADIAPPVDRPWFQICSPPAHSPEFHAQDFILFSLLYRRKDHENFINNSLYFNLIATSNNKTPNVNIPSGKLLQFILEGNNEDNKEHRRLYVKEKLFNAMANQIYVNSVDLLPKETRQSIFSFFCACKTIKNAQPPKFIKRKIITNTLDFNIDFMSQAYLTMMISDDIIKDYRSPKEIVNNKRDYDSISTQGI